jgi:hypothetical protein
MINLLGQHLNKSVSVSIPIIFKDEASHACKLVGIEVSGLWLESEEFGSMLFPNLKESEPPRIFVPFGQILFLVEASGPKPQPPVSVDPTPRGPSGRPARTAAGAVRTRRR